MPFLRRRPVVSAAFAIILIVAVMTLRLAIEWRQALADIDSMIVTPTTLDLASASHSTAPSVAEQHTTPVAAAANIPVDTPQAAPLPSAAADTTPTLSKETLNVLLLGTDARPQDEGPTRTDALVVVRIERDTGRVSMLSIPRDLWVEYASGGKGRINGAYATGEKRFGAGGGAAVAKATVGKLLDIEVDHFVLINFRGFKTLIDQLGGIEVDVPAAIYDPAYPTDDYGTIEVRFKAGAQQFDGERALIYARTRHADSDFGRNQRQQLVLMSIFNRIRERDLLQQLTSLDDYTGALRGYVQTDMSRSRMLEIAGFARDIGVDDVLRYAIDSSVIVDLRDPATFGVEPGGLRKIVSQFTGEAVSTAGGE